MIVVGVGEVKIKYLFLFGLLTLFLVGCTNNTIIPISEEDGNTYYEWLVSNETSLVNGTGTITEYLNSSDTVGLTYYEIIGDDDDKN